MKVMVIQFSVYVGDVITKRHNTNFGTKRNSTLTLDKMTTIFYNDCISLIPCNGKDRDGVCDVAGSTTVGFS